MKPKCKRCGSTRNVRLVSLEKPEGNWHDKRPAWLCRKCERKTVVDR